MLTVDEALDHLGIDYADEKVTCNVTAALKDAQAYLRSVVGDDVFELLPNDEKSDRLVKCYLTEMYDERSTSAKVGNAKREMVYSMEMQLRLELSRAREAAGVSV
jgi:uncharacterized protein involved in type VI secretion and phage assembly